MKRTLSAAASVVVGGAGAIAFPVAASAAPEAPVDQLPIDHVTNTAAHTGEAVHSAQQAVGDVVTQADPAAQSKSGNESGTPLDAVNGLAGEGQGPVDQLTGAIADSADSKSLPTDDVTDAVGKDLGSATNAVGDAVQQGGQNLPADTSQRAEPKSADAPAVAGSEDIGQSAVRQGDADAVPEQMQAAENDGSTAQQPQVGPLKDLADPNSPLGPITGNLPLDDPSPENVRQVSESITGELPGGGSSDGAAKSGPVTSDPTAPVQDLVQEGPLKHAPLG